jgi:hypothetical protein
LDDVDPAIAIHVEGDVGEVVDVVVVEFDLAEGMLDPGRRPSRWQLIELEPLAVEELCV